MALQIRAEARAREHTLRQPHGAAKSVAVPRNPSPPDAIRRRLVTRGADRLSCLKEAAHPSPKSHSMSDPESPRTDAGSLRAAQPGRRLREMLLGHVPDLVRVLALNTLIAAFLALVVNRFGFVNNLIFSHAIGLSIFILAVALSRLFGASRADAKALAIAVPLGCLAGIELACWITGDRLFAASQIPVGTLLATLALPLVIGTVATHYFYTRGLLAAQQAQLKQAELARALDQQRVIEARLKMLQAQIEPHFLFNTLSNILNLIEEDPATARTMLADLTRLLRRSLQRARLDSLPLAEELADIRAYVEIQVQRMGPRLRCSFQVDPGLESVQIAPYLVQPLVENAIRHGLEPQVGGGELRIGASRNGETLTIEVADTGCGLRADHPPGVALANIRARLAALYGERAALSLHPNAPSGVVARLRLPIAAQAVAP
jgi:two-component sensor histidine kinase